MSSHNELAKEIIDLVAKRLHGLEETDWPLVDCRRVCVQFSALGDTQHTHTENEKIYEDHITLTITIRAALKGES